MNEIINEQYKPLTKKEIVDGKEEIKLTVGEVTPSPIHKDKVEVDNLLFKMILEHLSFFEGVLLEL